MQDGDAYLSGNMAISYTLQKQQQELDKQIHLFSDRYTVYEHYNLWTLKA